MKVLIISLCSDPLSNMEFIKPIERILRHGGIEYSIKHYRSISQGDLKIVEKTVISGSPLKDHAFLEDEWFSWLNKFDKPVLGVGSSFQAIVRVFGGKIMDGKRIGVFKVRTIEHNKLVNGSFYAFFLTNKAAEVGRPLKVLAKAGRLDCMVKHESKEIYSCLFHPEVINPEIILNFALKV